MKIFLRFNLLIFCLLVSASFTKKAYAVVTIDQIYDVFHHELAAISHRYVKKVYIKGTPVGSFVYGNNRCGYFRSKNYRKVKDLYELSFIPTCYMEKTEVLVRTDPKDESYTLITNAEFKNEGKTLETIFNTSLVGNYKIPFTAVDVAVDTYKEGKKSLTNIKIVVNHFGEIVWSFLTKEETKSDLRPLGSNLKVSLTSSLKPLEDSEISTISDKYQKKFASIYPYENSLIGTVIKENKNEGNNTYISMNNKTFKEEGRLIIINPSAKFQASKAIPLKTFGGIESLGKRVR